MRLFAEPPQSWRPAARPLFLRRLRLLQLNLRGFELGLQFGFALGGFPGDELLLDLQFGFTLGGLPGDALLLGFSLRSQQFGPQFCFTFGRVPGCSFQLGLALCFHSHTCLVCGGAASLFFRCYARLLDPLYVMRAV